MKFSTGFLLLLITTTTMAQNSMVGDGFGGRLWYRPTNYTVGSYTAFSLCYSDPCDSSSNQLYGWGSDAFGQLGNGPGPNGSAVPVAIGGMNNVRYFTAGYLVGAIKNDGTGWIWLDVAGIPYPVQVITDAKFLDVGIFTGCFVKEDGTVWSIINNQFGQFGDGTTIDNYTTPVQMAGVTNAVRSAVSTYANFVLLADSTVLSSGSNYYGILGNPALTDTLYPIAAAVPGLTGIVDIKANSVAVAALDGNGDVFCWGQAPYTGDGDYVNDTQPKKLTGLSNIVAISGCAEGVHFLALDAYGNCFAWGDVNLGPYFSGLPILLTPVPVATDVIDIMAGETFSYIVKSDGTLHATGSSLDSSIWLNLPDTARIEFTPMDLSMVPSACPLVGTVAVPSTACNGSSAITVSHFGGQVPYQYDIGNGPQSSNVFNNVASGSYTVTVSDANGCTITVPCLVDPDGPDPVVLNMGTVVTCQEEGFTMPSGAVAVTSGSYVDTSLSVLGCDTVRLYDVMLTPGPWLVQQITVCDAEPYTLPNGEVVYAPGIFFIDTLEYADACDTIFSVSLVLSTLPDQVTFIQTPQGTEVMLGDSVELWASAGVDPIWSPSATLSCSACWFTVAGPTETTEYCLVNSNIDGCADTACVLITVISPPAPICLAENIFVPTAFSPNASGTNDQHCVRGGECIKSMAFGIYDRWGNKVFESTDPTACWDGTHNGQALDPAVFVYHLSATLAGGETVEKQGNITLVR